MQFVVLTGFQRNGASMISHSLHQIKGISHLAEIFATNKRSMNELLHPNEKWKVAIHRKLFGMDRIPVVIKPILKHTQNMSTPRCCNMILDALLEGGAQSELEHKISDDDDLLIGRVSFEHCPYYYDTWDHILSTKNCKVIYVTRENPLDLLISKINADQQCQWQVRHHEVAKYDKIEIDIRHLLEFLAFYQAHVDFFDLFFYGETNVLTISYENMVRHWDDSIKLVNEFLDIPEQDVPLVLKRQIPRDNHFNLVLNNKEIRDILKSTKWERYLHE